MCSGLRKIIEDASSLSHRLNISELHSFITMNNIERLFGTCYPFMRKKLILISNEAEKEAVISTYNSSLIRKLKNAMEEHAEINLVKDNPDGSCEFIIPKKWCKVSIPRVISEEEKLAMALRLRENFGWV